MIGWVFFEYPECIHSLDNYLLSTCCVPGTVWGFLFGFGFLNFIFLAFK